MRQEWLDRQIGAHPWRTVLVLVGGIAVGYAVWRAVDWQESIDARRLRRRRSGTAAAEPVATEPLAID